VPNVPGDLMLVFADARWPSVVHVEWHPLGLPDLVDSTLVPGTGWDFAPCWGRRFRDRDFWFDDDEFPHITLAVMAGMKIGGFSEAVFDRTWCDIEGARPTPLLEGPGWLVEEEGEFICRLNSISPVFDLAYPWMNQRTPLSENAIDASIDPLKIGDMNAIEFFLIRGERTAWRLSVCGFDL